MTTARRSGGRGKGQLKRSVWCVYRGARKVMCTRDKSTARSAAIQLRQDGFPVKLTQDGKFVSSSKFMLSGSKKRRKR